MTAKVIISDVEELVLDESNLYEKEFGKMKKRIVYSALVMVPMLMISKGCLAQPDWMNSSPEMMPKAFMEHEDGNGDGKVTADEFNGPKNDFTLFDVNGDGIIELSEAPTPDRLPDAKKMGPGMSGSDGPAEVFGEVSLNGVKFKLYKKYDFFTWDNLPDDVKYERMGIKEFTGPDRVTHYYQTVYVASGNLNWFQAAYLAQDAGGYLASINSEEENSFVFEQVSDKKFFWFFPPYTGGSRMNHYEIGIGPFLGGYQEEGGREPDVGWKWLSGEPWEYSNWAVNLNDGVIDKDPRDNSQPNDSGNSAVGQRVMGFGEMNVPVPTWGDYMDDVGTYGVRRSPGKSYGFIIEYEEKPSL